MSVTIAIKSIEDVDLITINFKLMYSKALVSLNVNLYCPPRSLSDKQHILE